VAQGGRSNRYVADGLQAESYRLASIKPAPAHGNDPQASVVNRNCQIHDVDNVFVIDSSVHVTNGGFNPVLTIMAIAYLRRMHCPSLEGHGIPVMKQAPQAAAIAIASWRLLLAEHLRRVVV